MTQPAERLRRIDDLVTRAETYRDQMTRPSHRSAAMSETLFFAALSELFEEVRALRNAGALGSLAHPPRNGASDA